MRQVRYILKGRFRSKSASYLSEGKLAYLHIRRQVSFLLVWRQVIMSPVRTQVSFLLVWRQVILLPVRTQVSFLLVWRQVILLPVRTQVSFLTVQFFTYWRQVKLLPIWRQASFQIVRLLTHSEASQILTWQLCWGKSNSHLFQRQVRFYKFRRNSASYLFGGRSCCSKLADK